jgi:hypothetical protein
MNALSAPSGEMPTRESAMFKPTKPMAPASGYLADPRSTGGPKPVGSRDVSTLHGTLKRLP